MTTTVIILISGYIAAVIGFGTWSIIIAKRSWREHKKFIKALKVGDEVKYRNLHFEILEMDNPNIRPPTGIRIKTEGWLYEEDFGFLRQVTKTK